MMLIHVNYRVKLARFVYETKYLIFILLYYNCHIILYIILKFNYNIIIIEYHNVLQCFSFHIII